MAKIHRIIERVGGPGAVGALCRITRQAVSQWKRVPHEHVLRIARFAATRSAEPPTPNEMRPDLYPHPLDGLRINGASRKSAPAQKSAR